MEQRNSTGKPARGALRWDGWAADAGAAVPAGLAYYEIYGSGGGCGAFGRYEGAKLDCLKSGVDSPVVTKDGYALVLPQGAGALAGTYRLHYGYSPHTLTIRGDSMRWGSEPVTPLEVVQGTGRDAQRYRLVPLPDEVMTEPLTSAGPNPDSFYRALEIEPLDSANRPIYELNRGFYFNPHFAKTVEKGGAEPPERSNTRTRAILIRTARHLYNIARFKSRYVLGYHTAYYFEQELDLDYATYTAYLGIGFPEGVSEAEPYIQDCIGTARRDKPYGSFDRSYQFKGTYDGGHHGIRNAAGSWSADQNTYSGGLFGMVGQDGILKNIAYTFNPKCVLLVSPSGVNMECYGALVGINEGMVEGCVVYSLKTPGSSNFRAGGLVGQNHAPGVIEDCSAQSAKLANEQG